MEVVLVSSDVWLSHVDVLRTARQTVTFTYGLLYKYGSVG